tara:strand:+ start:209 stop:328 length:120 start_codon:yes stop_codon:yes gene_type:complete
MEEVDIAVSWVSGLDEMEVENGEKYTEIRTHMTLQHLYE